MKSPEEIEKSAIDYAKTQVVRGKNLPEWDDKTEQLIARYFTKGYTQCQQDKLSEKIHKGFTIEQLIWLGVQSVCDEKCHCHAECNKADEVIEKLKSLNK